jgi:hypothetical protein
VIPEIASHLKILRLDVSLLSGLQKEMGFGMVIVITFTTGWQTSASIAEVQVT